MPVDEKQGDFIGMQVDVVSNSEVLACRWPKRNISTLYIVFENLRSVRRLPHLHNGNLRHARLTSTNRPTPQDWCIATTSTNIVLLFQSSKAVRE